MQGILNFPQSSLRGTGGAEAIQEKRMVYSPGLLPLARNDER